MRLYDAFFINMRKRIFGRRLKRDIDERRSLFRNLMRGMVLHGRIKTTEAKAKAIRGELEKLVTLARRKGDSARNDLLKKLAHEDLASRMINQIAPRFVNRPGGYTRILKIGTRVKDAAPMVFMEWVEHIEDLSLASKKNTSKSKTPEASTVEASGTIVKSSSVKSDKKKEEKVEKTTKRVSRKESKRKK